MQTPGQLAPRMPWMLDIAYTDCKLKFNSRTPPRFINSIFSLSPQRITDLHAALIGLPDHGVIVLLPVAGCARGFTLTYLPILYKKGASTQSWILHLYKSALKRTPLLEYLDLIQDNTSKSFSSSRVASNFPPPDSDTSVQESPKSNKTSALTPIRNNVFSNAALLERGNSKSL